MLGIELVLKRIIISSLMYHLTNAMHRLPEAERQEVGCSFKTRTMEEEERLAQNRAQAQIRGSLKKRYSQIEMISLVKMSTMKKKISRGRLMKS